MERAILALFLLCSVSAAVAQQPGSISLDSIMKRKTPDPITGITSIGDPNREMMVDQMTPDVTFAGADGEPVALSSFRGKPLLIDLWATECGPCLLKMPMLDRLYRETKDKGLKIVSFDQDQEPEKATQYMARHHHGWQNFHDTDRSVEAALKGDGIPLIMLVDAQGKIVYDGFGEDEAELRAAIAGLGPEFASVAPKKPQGDPAEPEVGLRPQK